MGAKLCLASTDLVHKLQQASLEDADIQNPEKQFEKDQFTFVLYIWSQKSIWETMNRVAIGKTLH